MSETTVTIEQPTDPTPPPAVVVVEDEGESTDHQIDAAVQEEQRLAALETRLAELESRQWDNASHEDVQLVVEEAVAEAAAVADVVAEETATEVADTVVEDVQETESSEPVEETHTPGRKHHWHDRPWREWRSGE